MMTKPMRSAGALLARYMNTYAHSPIERQHDVHTSHHFSRTFMMSRGYARAATVRANNRPAWTLDYPCSTSVHTSPHQIDEHILERRLALASA